MTPDQALAIIGPELASHGPQRTALDTLRDLVESAPEVACPSCGATIRARMADQADATELARLHARTHEIEQAARALVATPGVMAASLQRPWLDLVQVLGP